MRMLKRSKNCVDATRAVCGSSCKGVGRNERLQSIGGCDLPSREMDDVNLIVVVVVAVVVVVVAVVVVGKSRKNYE